MKHVIALGACALLTACATAPERVAAVAPPAAFAAGRSCPDYRAEQVVLRARLQALSDRQRSTRQTNAWAIALVGLPLASLNGGNVAPQIGQTKGELAVIDKALEGCS